MIDIGGELPRHLGTKQSITCGLGDSGTLDRQEVPHRAQNSLGAEIGLPACARTALKSRPNSKRGARTIISSC